MNILVNLHPAIVEELGVNVNENHQHTYRNVHDIQTLSFLRCLQLKMGSRHACVKGFTINIQVYYYLK